MFESHILYVLFDIHRMWLSLFIIRIVRYSQDVFESHILYVLFDIHRMWSSLIYYTYCSIFRGCGRVSFIIRIVRYSQDVVESVNSAESIIHDTESKMEEFKSQLPTDEVSFNYSVVSSLTILTFRFGHMDLGLISWVQPLIT